MDTFEINKISGAILGTLVFAMAIGVVAGLVFEREVPEKPGYPITVAEAPAESAGGGAPAAPAVPLPVLLAKADVNEGANISKKCQACHSLEKGGPNKVGPDLWGVVDRPVGEHAGFAYSAGMQAFSEGGKQHWTYENLNHFLTNPKGFVKGTAMGFAGVKDDQERADLIAYLRTLSDSPVPLPPVEQAAGGDAKPADGAAKPADGTAPKP